MDLIERDILKFCCLISNESLVNVFSEISIRKSSIVFNKMSGEGFKSYAYSVSDSSKSSSTSRCGSSASSLSSHFSTPSQRRKNLRKSRTEFNERRRIVFMGDAKVGKSSIIKRFLYNEFAVKYKRTVEEFYVADFKLSNGASLTLEMVDTTGSYDFPAMRDLAISKADAFVLVYSVGDVASWERIEELRTQVSLSTETKIIKQKICSNNFSLISFFSQLFVPFKLDFTSSTSGYSNHHRW